MKLLPYSTSILFDYAYNFNNSLQISKLNSITLCKAELNLRCSKLFFQEYITRVTLKSDWRTKTQLLQVFQNLPESLNIKNRN